MTSFEDKNRVKVWDPVVRVIHWAIVLGVLTAYFSGDEFPVVHVWAGYVAAIAIAMRLVWGFFGSEHARFSSFLTGPGAVFGYLSGLRTGDAKRYLGHNPAGAAMSVILLFSLTVTTVSGMALLAMEKGEGPLSGVIASSVEIESIEDDDAFDYQPALDTGDNYYKSATSGFHSAFTYLTLGLAALHVLGVIASSLVHKENLVLAMITGRKRQIGESDAKHQER